MGALASLFGGIMAGIYNVIPNYGLSIIIFTILTRIFLVPFFFKQIKSSRKMMELQPQIETIKKKFGADQQTVQRKTLELYKEHNYNPMAGCLPTIMSFILIIGMFQALTNPGEYVFKDPVKLQEATHQVFMWIPNLSLPDLLSNVIPTEAFAMSKDLPGLLPILSAILTYLSMQFSPTTSIQPQTQKQNGDQKPADPMAGMTRIMKIVFPIMILVYGRNMAAGIILYWTVGTLFQIVQQFIINRVLKKPEALN